MSTERPAAPVEVTPVATGAPSDITTASLSTTGSLELTEREIPPRAVYPLGLSQRDIRRLIFLLLAAGIGLYFLWLVQSILPPFLIAFFLAALLDPALRNAERRGRPRWMSIMSLYLLALLLILFLAVAVVPIAKHQFDDFTANFSDYYTNVIHTTNSFLQGNSRWLARFGITKQHLNDIITQKSGPVKNMISAILGGITGFLAGVASKAIWFIIIPIAGFFFMRDFPVLRARLIALFPEPYHKRIDIVSHEVVDVFSAYLRGLAKICGLYGFSAFVLFQLLGLRYALFLGLLAGIFYAVPYVGQVVTATVVGAVAYSMEQHSALLVFHLGPNSVGYTIGAIASVILMNNLFDQLVYPRVVGGSVGLHPVVSIFALAAGATLFGIWGMLLAVPVAASIQIILMYSFPRLRQPPPPGLVESVSPTASSV